MFIYSIDLYNVSKGRQKFDRGLINDRTHQVLFRAKSEWSEVITSFYELAERARINILAANCSRFAVSRSSAGKNFKLIEVRSTCNCFHGLFFGIFRDGIGRDHF